MIYYSLLPDRAVLEISGADARDFLQGLITKDVTKISTERAVFAALLSPQGRFLFDFFIIENEGKLLLETHRERLPELVKRLTMYRLRSKVEFKTLDMPVAVVWDEWRVMRNAHEITYADPRLPGLGWRMMLSPSSRGLTAGSHATGSGPEIPAFAGMTSNEVGDYDTHRLSLGVPEGAKDLIVDRSILLEYGYDELHGVDFDKGCYVGQEVTARSKHRATLRKFIHKVTSEKPLPPRDTPVLAGGREVGFMASSNGTLGLAHLKVEEVRKAQAENLPLMAGETSIEAALPPWCKTAFA